MEATARFIHFEEDLARSCRRYDGDASFLAGPTDATKTLWEKLSVLLKEERDNNGCYSVDNHRPSMILSHGPGYIDRDLEKIVGLQTEKPLERAMKPFGGIRIVEAAAHAYGYDVDPEVRKVFTTYVKTHNDAVFQCYTKEMRVCRSNHIITGLPDGYGRGRIIGDYRRVAKFGIDKLVELKEQDRTILEGVQMSEDNMRLRVELFDQIVALKQLKQLAAQYGHDIGRPAANSQEAIQWTYYGYLGSVKQQDGAAMSMGRLDNFLDEYIEKDLEEGRFTESQVQEFIDHFIMHLRIIRHLRSPEYNDLFAGDPTWITFCLGGCDKDGKHMVCRTSYRILNTLYNLGPAPEPNMTILWSRHLPDNFKRFCAQVSLDTSSIQYENDDLMRPYYGSDYSIACCVSAMALGKQMQFFGARCNLAKLLLYTINNGRDEKTKCQVGPKYGELPEGAIEWDTFFPLFNRYIEWLCGVYVEAMNIIHWSHDRYCYESLQMALHDTHVHRWIAFGIAGLSHVADSLAAIRYAKVFPIRDEDGIAVDFRVEGEFPKYGNDDDRADDLAVWAVRKVMAELRKHPAYRNSVHTLSILTITSNVMYGRATGSTPDGRKAGQPFAPGASPSYGADTTGAANALASVAKIPYYDCRDGVSNTFAILPTVLGKEDEERRANLAGMIDSYFGPHPSLTTAQHLNVNCVTPDTLRDAMAHPEKYPQLTIRVSGYAVNFVRLSPEQQRDVLMRTFHEKM